MAAGSEFSLALDVRCQLGEAPVWRADEGALWFTDIPGRRLHRFEPASGAHSSVECAEEVGCFAFTEDGEIVAAMRSAIRLLDRSGRTVRELAANPEEAAGHRFNDGGTDPRGRLWVGTLDEAKTRGDAHLYRYDSRGLTDVEGGLMTSNGIAFSPDGCWMYHSDTPRFAIYRYAYDAQTGTADARRDFVRLDADAADRARPDGGAVDVEGCYWTAMFEGGRVRRYSPAGELLGEYPVPARCPTMPAFGGPDMKTLFLTTARHGRPESELVAYPHSGGLFSMRVDVAGLPATPFRFEI